ncbi:unnamed protein product [Amaranthus hypochondriacus]
MRGGRGGRGRGGRGRGEESRPTTMVTRSNHESVVEHRETDSITPENRDNEEPQGKENWNGEIDHLLLSEVPNGDESEPGVVGGDKQNNFKEELELVKTQLLKIQSQFQMLGQLKQKTPSGQSNTNNNISIMPEIRDNEESQGKENCNGEIDHLLLSDVPKNDKSEPGVVGGDKQRNLKEELELVKIQLLEFQYLFQLLGQLEQGKQKTTS